MIFSLSAEALLPMVCTLKSTVVTCCYPMHKSFVSQEDLDAETIAELAPPKSCLAQTLVAYFRRSILQNPMLVPSCVGILGNECVDALARAIIRDLSV